MSFDDGTAGTEKEKSEDEVVGGVSVGSEEGEFEAKSVDEEDASSADGIFVSFGGGDEGRPEDDPMSGKVVERVVSVDEWKAGV